MRNILFEMLKDSFPRCRELEHSHYDDATDTGGVIISPDSTDGITIIVDEPLKDDQVLAYGGIERHNRNVFRISTTFHHSLSVKGWYICFLVLIDPTKEQLVETIKEVLETGDAEVGSFDGEHFESHTDLVKPLMDLCKGRDNTTGISYYHSYSSNKSFVRSSFLYKLEIDREQYIILRFSLVTTENGSSISHRTSFYSHRPSKLIMSSFPSDFKIDRTHLEAHYTLQSSDVSLNQRVT